MRLNLSFNALQDRVGALAYRAQLCTYHLFMLHLSLKGFNQIQGNVIGGEQILSWVHRTKVVMQSDTKYPLLISRDVTGQWSTCDTKYPLLISRTVAGQWSSYPSAL